MKLKSYIKLVTEENELLLDAKLNFIKSTNNAISKSNSVVATAEPNNENRKLEMSRRCHSMFDVGGNQSKRHATGIFSAQRNVSFDVLPRQ